MWRADMSAGLSGPTHWFDVEQIWTVLTGSPAVEVDGEHQTLHSGDTTHFPAGVIRQVHAGEGACFLVSGPSSAVATAIDACDFAPGEAVTSVWTA